MNMRERELRMLLVFVAVGFLILPAFLGGGLFAAENTLSLSQKVKVRRLFGVMRGNVNIAVVNLENIASRVESRSDIYGKDGEDVTSVRAGVDDARMYLRSARAELNRVGNELEIVLTSPNSLNDYMAARGSIVNNSIKADLMDARGSLVEAVYFLQGPLVR